MPYNPTESIAARSRQYVFWQSDGTPGKNRRFRLQHPLHLRLDAQSAGIDCREIFFSAADPLTAFARFYHAAIRLWLAAGQIRFVQLCSCIQSLAVGKGYYRDCFFFLERTQIRSGCAYKLFILSAGRAVYKIAALNSVGIFTFLSRYKGNPNYPVGLCTHSVERAVRDFSGIILRSVA